MRGVKSNGEMRQYQVQDMANSTRPGNNLSSQLELQMTLKII
jgi:hypothetical protein